MRCHRTAFPDPAVSLLGRLMLLAGASVVSLAIGVATVQGDQEESGQPAIEEPRALQTPVTLLPVTPGATEEFLQPAMSPAGPVVRLAPELFAHQPPRDRTASQAMEGVRAASFQGVTPGETTREQLVGKLGPPTRGIEPGAGESLHYEIGPFPHVVFHVEHDVVQSVVVHLASPSSREDVARELSLGTFRPVVIHDDQERPLGEVYPERGLMFAYQAGTGLEGEVQISHVVLEPISAEPFLLRAAQARAEHDGLRLADLLIARQLEPEDPVSYAQVARIDQRLGRPRTALESARKAVELDGDRVEYGLALADLKRELGEYREALDAVQALLVRTDLTPLEQSAAHLLHGRILAAMPPRDSKRAMQEAVTAVKLAAGETTSDRTATRRAARELLVESQICLAEILAYGPWAQKHEVVPQWLASAEKAAREYIEKDEGPRGALLSVYKTSLHCLWVLEGQGSPDTIADAVIELGRELITDADDDDYLTWIEWELGAALGYAARIALRQGKHADALRFASNADALWAEPRKARGESPAAMFQLGQLHFLIGSIHALHQHDHTGAVQWYDQALPRLRRPAPDSLSDPRGLLGEQLVSMGVSYWEANRAQQAVSVTEEGAEWMRQAVQDGALDKAALSVPYQNLASMHRQLGNEEQARALANQAADVAPDSTPSTRRR